MIISNFKKQTLKRSVSQTFLILSSPFASMPTRKTGVSSKRIIHSFARCAIYSGLESLPAPAASPATAIAASSNANPAKQLPRINLPQFSGNFIDWADFRDHFVSLVTSNQTLTNVERLHYLKTSMTGEAVHLLKNITTTGENFERAWTILTSRFEKKRLLISYHLNALTSLRAVTTESAAELKKLLN